MDQLGPTGKVSKKAVHLSRRTSSFSRLDRSDRNGSFHLTIGTHFQSQDLAVRYLLCTNGGKYSLHFYGQSISVTRTLN